HSPRHPNAMGIDMSDILLSMFTIYFYLALVVTLLIAAVWTREACATGPTTGRGVADALVAARCNLDPAPWRGSVLPPQPDRRPYRDLQATLSASYAARVEQEIRKVRVGPHTALYWSATPVYHAGPPEGGPPAGSR